MDVPNGMPGYHARWTNTTAQDVPRKNLTRSDAAEQPRGKTAVRKAFRHGSHVAHTPCRRAARALPKACWTVGANETARVLQ